MKIMKREIISSYSAPTVDIYEVMAERAYGDSVMLPSFGTENDDFIY